MMVIVPLTWFNLNLKMKEGCMCHRGPKRTVQKLNGHVNVFNLMIFF